MGLDDLTIWEAALHKLSDDLLSPEEKAQIYSLIFIKRLYMSTDVDVAIRALWRFEPSIYTVDAFSEKDGRALAALFKSLLPAPAPALSGKCHLPFSEEVALFAFFESIVSFLPDDLSFVQSGICSRR